MEAMEYEYLIRQAFGVGRHEVAGADADIYRRFERAKNLLEGQKRAIDKGEMKLSTLSIEDLEYDMRKGAATICTNVVNAINHVQKDADLDNQVVEKLENIKTKLWRLYDKERIDELIEETGNIFDSIGLKMG